MMLNRSFFARLAFFISVLTLASCSSYKQNIMFKTPDGFKGKAVTPFTEEARKNYVIVPDDYLKLQVFANQGERIIDPNNELAKEDGSAVNGPGKTDSYSFLVTPDGTVKLPMIGEINLKGMTIRQAEIQLQKEYDKYYKECYVILSFNNKRVTVLGAVGGQVIPLENENVTLVETLALAKGFGNDGRAGSIRVIRGQDVFLVDLSTIEGMQKTNMIVEPGDVIYVEPVRRPFVEGFRDVGPILSIVLSLATIVLVYTR